MNSILGSLKVLKFYTVVIFESLKCENHVGNASGTIFPNSVLKWLE